MNNIFIKLNLFIICLIIYLSNTQAQKWNFGAHIGLTSSKLLWADGKEIKAIANRQFPEKKFKQSISLGLSSNYLHNEKIYTPIQIDYYIRRFSLGTRGIAQIRNEHNEWITFEADYLDYRLHQMAISGGVGYNISKRLSGEIQPYFHLSITDQEIKIGEVIDWQKDDDFQQDFDFGLAGFLKGSFNHFYIKGGYQIGLRKIPEYCVFDIQGGSLGKHSIRNTMFLLLFGYQF